MHIDALSRLDFFWQLNFGLFDKFHIHGLCRVAMWASSVRCFRVQSRLFFLFYFERLFLLDQHPLLLVSALLHKFLSHDVSQQGFSVLPLRGKADSAPFFVEPAEAMCLCKALLHVFEELILALSELGSLLNTDFEIGIFLFSTMANIWPAIWRRIRVTISVIVRVTVQVCRFETVGGVRLTGIFEPLQIFLPLLLCIDLLSDGVKEALNSLVLIFAASD